MNGPANCELFSSTAEGLIVGRWDRVRSAAARSSDTSGLSCMTNNAKVRESRWCCSNTLWHILHRMSLHRISELPPLWAVMFRESRLECSTDLSQAPSLRGIYSSSPSSAYITTVAHFTTRLLTLCSRRKKKILLARGPHRYAHCACL